MFATALSISTSAPLTNGSWTSPTRASSKTQVPRYLYGAITLMVFTMPDVEVRGPPGRAGASQKFDPESSPSPPRCRPTVKLSGRPEAAPGAAGAHLVTRPSRRATQKRTRRRSGGASQVSNAEVERPPGSAGRAQRAHAIFQRPRRVSDPPFTVPSGDCSTPIPVAAPKTRRSPGRSQTMGVVWDARPCANEHTPVDCAL